MAVTPTTMTELADLAKDYYTNVYRQLPNTEVPLKAQFEQLERFTFTGRKIIFGVKTAVGGGASNAGANKQIPAADEGEYDQGEATVVRTYTRMALDNLAIEVTKAQSGSYRPAVAEVMQDRLAAHDLEVNRQLFCGGDGKVALIQTGANSTSQALERDYGVVNGGEGARHIHKGDQVAVYSADGSTLRGRATVTAVDKSASPNTMTLSGALNTTTGDFVSKSTADDDNKTSGEAKGLLAAVKDSDTLFAIPATGLWKAYRNSNGGNLRPLTDGMLLETLAVVRARSRKVPNLVVTRPGVTLKYSESFLPLRRIQGQETQLKGGFKPVRALMHGGGEIPVLEDLDCPDSRLFLIHTDAFRMIDLIGTEWFDGDGAQFTRITDKDGIEGFIRKYWALVTIERHANAVIEDIDDVAEIDRQ